MYGASPPSVLISIQDQHTLPDNGLKGTQETPFLKEGLLHLEHRSHEVGIRN
jgi:hypothetical protein